MFIVMSGNAFDGMDCWGMFEEHDKAVEWAERNCDEWYVVAVQDVDKVGNRG